MAAGRKDSTTLGLRDFLEELESPRPVYVVVTEQSYLAERARRACEAKVPEEARDFDWAFYDLGGDRGRPNTEALQQAVNEVLQTARTLPWFGGRRWIYVRNAHLAASMFKDYLAAPQDHTVLVLEVAKWPRGWPAVPRVEEKTEGREAQWLVGRARQEGFRLEPGAAELLLERVGNDLQALASELDKLILYRWGESLIRVEDVLEMTSNVRERDIFDLSKALAEGDPAAAVRLLDQLFDSGLQAPQIIGLLYWNFKRILALRESMEKGGSFDRLLPELKLWSFRGRKATVLKYTVPRLRDFVLRLREADLLVKSSGGAARLHLERLLVDMCRAGSL
ncbi:MAG: hypothetical protein Kow00109_12850 [Acidobacteriota bacterium]